MSDFKAGRLGTRGTRILITGGTGSFGTTVARALLDSDVSEVRILSRDEAKQEDLRGWLADDRALFYVGDVRDHRSVDGEMFGVDFACSTQHR